MVSGQLVMQMRRIFGCVAFWLVVCTAPLVAQTRISAAEFLAIADGRTLYFHDYATGGLVGIEQFLSRRISVWRRNDQSCTYGKITIENELLCFDYDDEPPGVKHCWVVFQDGDQILVRTPDLFNPDVQFVNQITDHTLNCPDPPIS